MKRLANPKTETTMGGVSQRKGGARAEWRWAKRERGQE